MDSSASTVRRDLVISMGLLTLIILLALGRIAWGGNWLKVLRVSLGFLTYSLTLLALFRSLAQPAVERGRLPFWIFAAAAAAAELCSGWLRPDWRLSDMAAMPVVAAFLIGGLHWCGLRLRRGLRERIVAGRDSVHQRTV